MYHYIYNLYIYIYIIYITIIYTYIYILYIYILYIYMNMDMNIKTTWNNAKQLYTGNSSPIAHKSVPLAPFYASSASYGFVMKRPAQSYWVMENIKFVNGKIYKMVHYMVKIYKIYRSMISIKIYKWLYNYIICFIAMFISCRVLSFVFCKLSSLGV